MTDREWLQHASDVVQVIETQTETPQDRIRAAIRILRVADTAADRVLAAHPGAGCEQVLTVRELLRRAMAQLGEFL